MTDRAEALTTNPAGPQRSKADFKVGSRVSSRAGWRGTVVRASGARLWIRWDRSGFTSSPAFCPPVALIGAESF